MIILNLTSGYMQRLFRIAYAKHIHYFGKENIVSSFFR